MALRTLDTLGPLDELPLVIVLVAVRAFRKRNFLLEVAAFVAGCAIDLRMFAFQRILRFRVIEVLVNAGQ